MILLGDSGLRPAHQPKRLSGQSIKTPGQSLSARSFSLEQRCCWVGQFHRSVHGSGHDDRCQFTHRPMEVPTCRAHRWSCTSARRSFARWLRIRRRVGRRSPVGWVDTSRRSLVRSPAGAGAGGTAQRRRRLEAPGPLRDRIAAELRLGRSPEAIRADLVAGGAGSPPCVETIYQALYAGALDVKPAECLRSRRRRRRCGQQRNPRSRPRGPNISQRPAAADDRSEAGHCARADHRSPQPILVIWLVERQTRYAIPVTMPDGYSADAALAGLIEGLNAIPPHLCPASEFGAEMVLSN